MANVIPAESAEFETAGSTGNFVAWFGCTVAQSTLQALNGTGSMEITATDTSIGIQQDNWPGFSITGGQDFGISISGWKANPSRSITVDFDWRDEGGTSQLLSTLTLNVGGSAWATVSDTVTVPGTTSRLFITATWSGSADDVVYIDSVIADDAPGSGGVTGSGAATAPVATASGTGTVEITGTGSATSPTATVTGSASVAVEGSGAATAPAAMVSGTATLGDPAIIGTGTVTSPTPQVSGAGSVTVGGSGTIVTTPALISGTGAVVITGTGAVTSPAVRVSGSASELPPPEIPEVLTLTTVADTQALTAVPEVLTLTVIEGD